MKTKTLKEALEIQNKLAFREIDHPEECAHFPKRGIIVKKIRGKKIPFGSIYIGNNFYLVEWNGTEKQYREITNSHKISK